jgi:thiol-disulfide isomerase/thioredoxin
MTLAAASLCAAPPLAEAKSRAEVVTHFDRRSDLRVLNVWATWCAPCVAEMPELQKIHEAYGRRGVSLVALSMDDVLPGSREEARERVESFVASRSLSFPTLLYIGSIPEIETEFNLSGEIPVTIVFDRKGREVKRIEGILDGPSFRAELDRLLAVDTANAN